MNDVHAQNKPVEAEDSSWEVLSQLYFEKLHELIAALNLGAEPNAAMSVRHYFNGAAVWAGNILCVSWSPVGLAFRLPPAEVTRLIANGQAKPLKYFAKRPVKPGYALFENPQSKPDSVLKAYFLRALEQAQSAAVENRA